MWHPLEPTTRNNLEHVLIINGSRGVESDILNCDEKNLN